MKKRLVVIGANGFLGSTFCKKFDSNFFELKKVTSKNCNLLERNSITYLQKEIKEDDIIIFAAAKAPAKNWDMLGTNLGMVNNFVEGIKKINVKYILNVSSDAVYSDSTSEINEESSVMPDNPHGYMHYVREKILEENLDIPIGHIRPTLVYGMDDPHNGYGPNSFLRLAKEGKDIALFGEGEELRDHIYVEDVAKIAMCMVENCLEQKINAVSAKPMTFYKIAETIKNLINPSIKILNTPRTNPMPHNGFRVFKASKIISTLPTFKAHDFSYYIKDSLDE